MNPAPLILTTIVFPLKDSQVLLGMKKRGFGAGWWNGFGGKLDTGEAFEASARRETREEAGLQVNSLQPVAYLVFYFEDVPTIANVAYTTTDFTGTPTETEEMRPQWFDMSALPYDTMWPGDKQWIPAALAQDNAAVLYFSLFFKSDNTFVKSEPASAATIGKYFVLA
jgi:8-oxo-dGTP diphosphatase/2-hydroxy-dATP diphosphatase